MRMLIFIMFISFFSWPVLANQEDMGILPFAYVTWDGDRDYWLGNYDLHVINVYNGESLYELNTTNSICPLSLVSDGKLLLQLRNNQEKLGLLAFDTNSYSLQELVIDNVRLISASDNQVAYSDSQAVYIYDISSDTRTSIFYGDETISQARFLAADFVFVTQDSYDFYRHQWNGAELTTKRYDRLASDWISYSISPDGRYLTVVYSYLDGEPIGYLIDTNSDTISILPELHRYEGHQNVWRPLAEPQFAYLDPEGNMMLYTVENESAEKILEIDSSSRFEYFYWSPDGSFLTLFKRVESEMIARHTQIEILDVETGESALIIPNRGLLGHLRWLSPSQVVYTHALDGISNNDIYLYNTISREHRQVTDTPDVNEMFYCMEG